MGMNWGAAAGGVAAGLETGQRMRLQRDQASRETERHQFDMGEKQRAAEGRDRQEAAWDELNAAIARRLQKQAPTQVPGAQAPAAAAAGGEAVDQGNGVQTMPFQDDGAGIQTRALPEAPGAAPGFTPVQAAPAEGGLTRAPAAAPQPTKQGDDPGKQIGFSLYQNPNLLRDPEFLNEAAGIFMKARMPDGVKWLERSFKVQQENGIDAMKAFLAGDAQSGIRAFNSAGREKIESATPITEGANKGKWELRAQGVAEPMIVDPGAALRSFLDPKAYFDMVNKEQEGKRKDAESGALVAERNANVRLREAQAGYYSGARTAQANAQASRATRPPESKESVDRAHQFVDATLQRLASVTDAKGVQIIDPDTKKPSVDQTKQNHLYQLYNDVQMDVETALGRDLSSREIRFLGQRMASAPLTDDAKRSAWAQQTVSLLTGRPSNAAGKQPASSGRQGPSSAPPADGTRVRGPDGRVYVVKDGQPVPEQGSAPAPSAAPQSPADTTPGLTRRPAAATPSRGILGSVSIQDQSAAAPMEARNPRLKQIGDALRVTASAKAGAMQSQAAELYQEYIAELQRALGVSSAQGAITIRPGAPSSIAGLQRSGG